MKQVCSVELAILAWMDKPDNYLSLVAGRHLGFCRIQPKFELGLYFTSVKQYIKFGSDLKKVGPLNFMKWMAAILDFSKFIQYQKQSQKTSIQSLWNQFEANPFSRCGDNGQSPYWWQPSWIFLKWLQYRRFSRRTIMKPWYQYQTSLFSGVGDIGVDGKTGELPKFGYWPPSWILPNSNLGCILHP